MTYLDVRKNGISYCTPVYTTSVKQLSEPKKHQQDCLMLNIQSFYNPCLQLAARSLAVFPGMCHSSTHPGISLHMTQFYQAFPRVSTASNKQWGEKAWERGYFGVRVCLCIHGGRGQLTESHQPELTSIIPVGCLGLVELIVMSGVPL